MPTSSTARRALADAAPAPCTAGASRIDPVGWNAVPSLEMWTVDEITGNACPCCHCVYSLAREKVSGPDGRHACRLCTVLLGVPTSAEATR